MKLSDIIAMTGDHHAKLDTGAVTVNVQNDEADYWHLSDYAVSTRAGMMLVMTPRNLPVLSHADNNWKHHYSKT